MNKQGKNGIEWCDYTWSPITGCLHGCEYCYARRIANRFGMPQYDNECHVYTGKAKCYDDAVHTGPFPWGFAPTFHKYRLDEPQKIKKPSKIFVCSMADLFGDWVPDEWIERVFNVAIETNHQYLFLTKNPKRYNAAIEYFANEERGYALSEGYWDNFWFGTTITSQEDIYRIPDLLKFPEGHKFISIEPLLEPVDLTRIDLGGNTWINALTGNWKCYHPYGGVKTIEKSRQRIDWVIIGQQTGPGAVPPKVEWVQSIIDQCRAVDVPVFVKSPLYEKFPIQEWPEGLK
jgi:protein gp37